MSTASQVPGTCSRFFADATSVWLLRVPVERVAHGLKWEAAGSGGVFAHLYGVGLGSEEVVGRREVRRGEGWDKVDWEGVFAGEDGWDS